MLMSFPSRISKLQRVGVRCRVNPTRASLSRANIPIIHLALSPPGECVNASLPLCVGSRCFSSSLDASSNRKRERYEIKGDISIISSELLDEKRHPIGSFTPTIWAQARRALNALIDKTEITSSEVGTSFSLLERMIKEHSVTGNMEKGKWLYKRTLLNGLVKNWRNVAKKHGGQTIHPVDLGTMLEQLSKLVPKFKYDTFTFSMIMDVAIDQKPPKEAPAIAESLLDYLKKEADKGKPELQPDVVIWNQVFNTWANSGLPEAPERMEALMERMKAEGLEATAHYWSCLMKYWANSRRPERLEKMEELLERMKTQGVEPSVITWTQLIQAHATSGRENAPYKVEAILDEMLCKGLAPDIVNWMQALKAWSKSNLPNAPERAEAVFQRMQNAGVEPDVVSYSNLIYAHASRGNAERAEDILYEMIESGSTHARPNSFTCNHMLLAYCNSNDHYALQRAEEMLEDMIAGKIPGVSPDIISFSIVIRTCLQGGDPPRADRILQRMENIGMRPDTRFFSPILKAWVNLRNPAAAEKAETILMQMIQLSESSNPSAKPNTYSFNLVIEGWVHSGDKAALERAMKIFDMMDSGSYGVSPNLVSFALLIRCMIQTGEQKQIGEADSILRRVPSSEVVVGVDEFFQLQQSVIQAWIRAGHFEEAELLQLNLYKRHQDTSVRPIPKWYTVIMQSWIEATEIERADALYQKMQELEASGCFSCFINRGVGRVLIEAWKNSDHPDKEQHIALMGQKSALSLRE